MILLAALAAVGIAGCSSQSDAKPTATPVPIPLRLELVNFAHALSLNQPAQAATYLASGFKAGAGCPPVSRKTVAGMLCGIAHPAVIIPDSVSESGQTATVHDKIFVLRKPKLFVTFTLEHAGSVWLVTSVSKG